MLTAASEGATLAGPMWATVRMRNGGDMAAGVEPGAANHTADRVERKNKLVSGRTGEREFQNSKGKPELGHTR